MGLAAGQILLIRCEVNRLADLARLAGVKDPLPRVDFQKATVDAALVDAAAQATGYALTTWELQTVRALGTYRLANDLYDAAEAFADAPSARALARRGVQTSILLAALAQLRQVPDPCGVVVKVPGISPPDPAVVTPTLPRAPAPAAPAPRERGRKVGYAIVGGISAATIGLVLAALKGASAEEPQIPVL